MATLTPLLKWMVHMLKPLPDGWEARKAENGRLYYLDHHKEITTWEHPLGLELDEHGLLPAGWEKRVSEESGNAYFLDHKRKITTWKDPRTTGYEWRTSKLPLRQQIKWMGRAGGKDLMSDLMLDPGPIQQLSSLEPERRFGLHMDICHKMIQCRLLDAESTDQVIESALFKRLYNESEQLRGYEDALVEKLKQDSDLWSMLEAEASQRLSQIQEDSTDENGQLQLDDLFSLDIGKRICCALLVDALSLSSIRIPLELNRWVEILSSQIKEILHEAQFLVDFKTRFPKLTSRTMEVVKAEGAKLVIAWDDASWVTVLNTEDYVVDDKGEKLEGKSPNSVVRAKDPKFRSWKGAWLRSPVSHSSV